MAWAHGPGWVDWSHPSTHPQACLVGTACHVQPSGVCEQRDWLAGLGLVTGLLVPLIVRMDRQDSLSKHFNRIWFCSVKSLGKQGFFRIQAIKQTVGHDFLPVCGASSCQAMPSPRDPRLLRSDFSTCLTPEAGSEDFGGIVCRWKMLESQRLPGKGGQNKIQNLQGTRNHRQ